MKLPVRFSLSFSIKTNVSATVLAQMEQLWVFHCLISGITYKNEALYNNCTVLQISIDLKISHRVVCFFVSLCYHICSLQLGLNHGVD